MPGCPQAAQGGAVSGSRKHGVSVFYLVLGNFEPTATFKLDLSIIIIQYILTAV